MLELATVAPCARQCPPGAAQQAFFSVVHPESQLNSYAIGSEDPGAAARVGRTIRLAVMGIDPGTCGRPLSVAAIRLVLR